MAELRREEIQMELEKALNTKKWSPIWICLEKEGVDDDITRVLCYLCGAFLSYNKVQGSSNLRKHLKDMHPNRAATSEPSSLLPSDPIDIAQARGTVLGLLRETLNSLVYEKKEHLKLSNAASDWACHDETLSADARAALEDLSDRVLLLSASLKEALGMEENLTYLEVTWNNYRNCFLKRIQHY